MLKHHIFRTAPAPGAETHAARAIKPRGRLSDADGRVATWVLRRLIPMRVPCIALLCALRHTCAETHAARVIKPRGRLSDADGRVATLVLRRLIPMRAPCIALHSSRTFKYWKNIPHRYLCKTARGTLCMAFEAVHPCTMPFIRRMKSSS